MFSENTGLVEDERNPNRGKGDGHMENNKEKHEREGGGSARSTRQDITMMN